MNLQRYSADAGHIMEGKTELNLTDAKFEAEGGIEMDGMAWSEFFSSVYVFFDSVSSLLTSSQSEKISSPMKSSSMVCTG